MIAMAVWMALVATGAIATGHSASAYPTHAAASLESFSRQ
jgi:hypothetical protein